MFDDAMYHVSENRFLRRLLIPLARAYVRYAPVAAGKPSLWQRIVEPYFAWHSHEFVAPTVFGSKVAGNTKDVIQQYIYYFGVFEPNLTNWIRQRLSPGDTFIDVGANIGYFSLLASKLVGPSGAVVAVEASPTTFGDLARNLERNRATNVRAVNVAASDQRGTVKLFRGPEHNIGMTGLFDEQEGIKMEFQCMVEAAPLAEILHAEELQKARLIKIDVEGAEWAVVGGMGRIFESGRPDLEIVVEIHPELLEVQGKRVGDLMDQFQRAGFYPYQLAKDFLIASHVRPTLPPRPQRLDAPIEEESDIVFSRVDAAHL
jgi:FkbM family methyltransferase